MSSARNSPRHRLAYALPAALIATLAVLTTGCASPGPPRPPTLNLPRPITDLTAERIGDKVTLQWTTPTKTTDSLPIKGSITAHLCRTSIAADTTAAPTPALQPTPKTPAKKSSSGKKSASPKPTPTPATCTPVLTIPIHPGPSTVTDTLPESLTADPATLLDYRVEIDNASGHSAGSSNPAYAASGAAPIPIQSLRATAIPTGIMLEWTPAPSTPATTVELDRIDSTLATAKPAQAKPNSPAPLQLAGKETPEVQLSANPSNSQQPTTNNQPAGTIDQTAHFGDTYSYTAQRVRTLQLNGQTLQIRSTTSAPITLTLRDTFPPAIPTGLVAIPNQQPTASNQQPPSIDLSWEPNTETDLAGYYVYRKASSGPATRLNPAPLPGPAYRDITAVPGQHYTYTVTAIDTSGNESPPTPELEQTLPQP
jgi:fibronectin type 3 domain-containing protein